MSDDAACMRAGARCSPSAAAARTSPNPMVGARRRRRRRRRGRPGLHERAGEPHAEVHALDEAGDAGARRHAYCTLEPCCHTRAAPVRARRASSTAGIARVVAASRIRIRWCAAAGFAYLREHGIEVDVGVLAAERGAPEPAVLHLHPQRPAVRDR